MQNNISKLIDHDLKLINVNNYTNDSMQIENDLIKFNDRKVFRLDVRLSLLDELNV